MFEARPSLVFIKFCLALIPGPTAMPQSATGQKLSSRPWSSELNPCHEWCHAASARASWTLISSLPVSVRVNDPRFSVFYPVIRTPRSFLTLPAVHHLPSSQTGTGSLDSQRRLWQPLDNYLHPHPLDFPLCKKAADLAYFTFIHLYAFLSYLA